MAGRPPGAFECFHCTNQSNQSVPYPPFRRFRVLSTQLSGEPSSHDGAVAKSESSDRWAKWRAIEARIQAGEVILMDGATGTEVERRVKEMGNPTAVNKTGWSCAQALHHKDVCQEVHASYYAAGSEVVIANTYASNRMVLDRAGYGEQVREVHSSACDAAMAARATAATRDDALVVGSISAHPPEIVAGGGSMGALTDGATAPSKDTHSRAPTQVQGLQKENTDSFPAPEIQVAAFREQAQLLAAGGCDVRR
eukprot:COSAG02_NODE_3656_length_6410_cov_2.706703_4_plen_253_part_00